MDNKICSRCKKSLPLSMYWKRKDRKIGVISYCKDCGGIRARSKEVIVARNKYNKSEKHKACVEKYEKTERGKEVRRKIDKKQRLVHNHKYRARYLLGSSIKRGRIKKRSICEICYDSPTECHHEDYSKPFEFIELCKKCHTTIHKN